MLNLEYTMASIYLLWYNLVEFVKQKIIILIHSVFGAHNCLRSHDLYV